MRKPVMYENTAWERENLSLILQPAESGRKDNPVIIPLEIRSRCLSGNILPRSLIGIKMIEIHKTERKKLIKKIKPKSHKYSHHKGNDANLFQEWVKVFLFLGLQDTSLEFGQWEEENHYDKSIIILRLKELIYPQEYENQNQWKLHQEHLIHHRSTEAEPQCKCIFS